MLRSATSALLAAAALTVLATNAGARDNHRDHRDAHVNYGRAPHFNSGPAPSARHVERLPNYRSGGQPQVHFKGSHNGGFSGNGSYNGGFNGGGVRHVERHHRFRAPVANFAIPHVYEQSYYADDECYVWQPAMTPLGWRYIWMNVCND